MSARIVAVALLFLFVVACGRYGPPKRIAAEPQQPVLEERSAGSQPADSKQGAPESEEPDASE